MQMDLLRDRSKNIDVQIRKHQTRLHNIELKRQQHGEDEKSLEELVITYRRSTSLSTLLIYIYIFFATCSLILLSRKQEFSMKNENYYKVTSKNYLFKPCQM